MIAEEIVKIVCAHFNSIEDKIQEIRTRYK